MEKSGSNNELFKFCKYLMIMAGVWSNGIETHSSFKRKLYKAYSTGGQIYYVTCIILFVVELFVTIKAGDMESRSTEDGLRLKALCMVNKLFARKYKTFPFSIIGPLFIDGNLTGEVYAEMLNRTIEPRIIHEVKSQRDVDGNPSLEEPLLHFLLGLCTSSLCTYSRRVVKLILFRERTIEWPPKSNAAQFLSTGELKSVVFKTQPDSIEDLKGLSRMPAISPDILQKVREEFVYRLYLCLEDNGNHIEQIIKKIVIANVKSLTFVTTIIAKMVLCQTKKIVRLINSALAEENTILSSESIDIKNIYIGHVKFCKKVLIAIVTALYVAGITCLAEVIFAAFCDSFGYFKKYNFLYTFNQTVAESLKKPHPIQFWFPFDKDVHYTWAMTYECIHISQSLIFNGAAQALVNSAMIFLRAELKVLQHYIRNFDKFLLTDQVTNAGDTSKRTIKSFAMKHQELIRWVQDFNESFQYILLLEYCIISIMLATTLIQLYQGEKIPFNTFFFMFCSLQLFILAWNANEILIESSSGLINSLYDSKWYLENEKDTKILIRIMMMRCLKPLAISIGPFGIMTMDAAISRMKLSYSVLSVLSSKS